MFDYTAILLALRIMYDMTEMDFGSNEGTEKDT
jgi:hypothetical protein